MYVKMCHVCRLKHLKALYACTTSARLSDSLGQLIRKKIEKKKKKENVCTYDIDSNIDNIEIIEKIDNKEEKKEKENVCTTQTQIFKSNV